jgi:transcription elongation factor Elf1
VLGLLFIIAALGFCALVFFSVQDEHVMPFACPACSYDGNSSTFTLWYSVRGQLVRCRSCGAAFREHSNGTLVKHVDH